MTIRYTLASLKVTSLSTLPGAWEAKQYRELLKLMEYEEADSLREEELQEYCQMALTDHRPEDAAGIVLGYLFKGALKPGQIQNLAHEMPEEKLWEEYSDLSLHEPLFNAHQLLYQAFQKGFPRPEALQFQVRVTAGHSRDLEVFTAQPEAELIRLLVQGMPVNTRITRFYEGPLRGGPFQDAGHILWQLRMTKEAPASLFFEGISSHYWFSDLRQVASFVAERHQE